MSVSRSHRKETDRLQFIWRPASRIWPWHLNRDDKHIQHRPFAELHRAVADPSWSPPEREEVIEKYAAYAHARVAEGHRLRNIVRHAQGLYAGLPHVRSWRRYLSEQAANPAANADLLLDSLRIVRAA